MKIAFIGQKGVPATYGGVERHVEELGARLAALGHEVVVFTRPTYTPKAKVEHRGMRLVSVPTIGTKHLDAIVHSLLATLVSVRGGYDIIHYHSIGPCLVSPLALLSRRKVVATIHGQDWRRGKWGRVASLVLRIGEWMALRVPHATICVSEVLTERFREQGAARITYIPNGVSTDPGDDTSVLLELGVQPDQYVLFVGRLVPEKGLHYLLDAVSDLAESPPLVVAGDSSASDSYAAKMRESASSSVVFAGYVYGARLAALFRHCGLFVLPSDLEGLPIVLLEALAYGAPILASDITPNMEVLGAYGDYFRAGDAESLRVALARCLMDSGCMKTRAQELRDSALAQYDWDRVAKQTEALYESLVHSKELG